MHILHVVGARPNFIKAAPVIAALAGPAVRQTLVHTGQHFDPGMSEVFFQELGLPQPDVNLEVGAGSHAVQTAEIMQRFEPVLLERKPDWVTVYGDINSTAAAALVGAKAQVPVAHVEAGLRSGDRSMPEEINRLVTDQLADLLFTPSPDGDANLRREGIPADRIKQVGNVMIDTLVRLLPQAEQGWPRLQAEFGLARYGLVTLHRPSNVDDPPRLASLLEALGRIGRDLDLLFPVHPRTRRQIAACGVKVPRPVRLLAPQGYLDFLALQRQAAVVITDSGGIQEETTFLGVPCLTLRTNTERPVTVTLGTNLLVGHDLERLQSEVARILAGQAKGGQIPALWDGHAAERIAAILLAPAAA
ncbi:MAG: UDP-N-acetylglucosamine 2-epimerase (non-hydrolyzing) [Anaerolineales bacterium]|nr:UDP-N-acetylglucosamine 2-epimerase (non-hydrolyzing) [Anaerolineales bacterium]